MTATVDSPPVLPVRRSRAGASILADDGNGGGLEFIGKSLNTAYEKSRTHLVNQPPIRTLGSELIYIPSGGGTGSVRFRVKCLGFSGGEVTTETVKAKVCLYWQATGGSPTALVGVDIAGASTTASQTVSYSTDTSGVNEWLDIPDLSVDDDQEYLDITVSALTNADMGNFYLDGVEIYYAGTRTTLVADEYSNGFVPVHDQHTAANAPCSSPLLHVMHKNVEVISRTRQGGNIIADAHINLSDGEEHVYGIWIPPGATSLKVWVDYAGAALSSNTGSFTLGGVTQTVTSTAALAAWQSALTFDVTALAGSWQIMLVEHTGAGGVAGVCAYIEDLDENPPGIPDGIVDTSSTTRKVINNRRPPVAEGISPLEEAIPVLFGGLDFVIPAGCFQHASTNKNAHEIEIYTRRPPYAYEVELCMIASLTGSSDGSFAVLSLTTDYDGTGEETQIAPVESTDPSAGQMFILRAKLGDGTASNEANGSLITIGFDIDTSATGTLRIFSLSARLVPRRRFAL